MADKEEITTENIVAHFGFTATSAKRYLRQLTDFGYLEAIDDGSDATTVPLRDKELIITTNQKQSL